ncbi:MAG TPA: TIM barrel protein [Planctomycetota bacterium]|nr:TIM barrel protein [Planctomycetota bacterium]
MYKCMVAGCIGIDLPWEEGLTLAASSGFEAVDVPLDVAKGAGPVREALAAHGLRPGGTPLPVQFRRTDAEFDTTLAQLDARAALAVEIGCDRFYTWILPASDERTFEENYRLHVERLGRCATVLNAHGCRLGLEFVGPRTSREGQQYEFIHTLGGMMKLAEDVGPNAGLLLDSWHWYTSHGTVDDLLTLTDDDLVYVHVNVAPSGVDVDEQMDLVRTLPGETGVEDITGFMGALVQAGYTGPVTPEPFLKALSEMSPEDAARRTGEAMRKIWPR